jgi:hypothetical protein
VTSRKFHVRARKLSATFLSCAFLLALTACSSSAPPAVLNTSETSDKSADFLTRDLFVCITNAATEPVSIAWYKGENGMNSNTGEGELAPKKTFCAEGHPGRAAVTFSDGFTTGVLATNRPFEYPELDFIAMSGGIRPDPALGYLIFTSRSYASAHYAQGEYVESDVEGHHIAVTRLADTDWINFSITILK